MMNLKIDWNSFNFVLKQWPLEYETGKIAVELKLYVFDPNDHYTERLYVHKHELWQIYIVKFTLEEIQI